MTEINIPIKIGTKIKIQIDNEVLEYECKFFQKFEGNNCFTFKSKPGAKSKMPFQIEIIQPSNE